MLILIVSLSVVAYFAIAFFVHTTITYWELSEPQYSKLSKSTVIQAALLWPFSLLILGIVCYVVSWEHAIDYSEKLAQKRFDRKHGDKK